MPIIKKSNEKLIDYCGCYTVEKKFSNRADWLLGCRSWHKMGSFHCCWSYWKKVPSLDFCCIIILMDNLAYLATNFYERDEHKPIEKFCTLCALKGRSFQRNWLWSSFLLFPSKIVSFLQQGVAILPRRSTASQPFADCLTLFLSQKKQHWQSQMD